MSQQDDQNSKEEPHTKEIRAIAVMEGCFPEKFGIPRQSGIAKTARGVIRLLPPFNHENFLHGLELSSHIWLTFGFHQNEWRGKATVRPQRLGGNERMGVFATRSSFRPNGLGLSAVKIEHIDFAASVITVTGHDLVDGTPIYDIKPYIPFADSLPEAMSEFAIEAPENYPVTFSAKAESTLKQLEVEMPALRALIVEVIAQNPTPQFHDDSARIYGVSLHQWDILFQKELDEDHAYPEKGAIDDDKVLKRKLKGFSVTEIKMR